MKHERLLVMFGALVGLSTALAVIILSDKKLKKEAQKQVASVLRNTNKIVKHFKKVSMKIAPEQYAVNESQDELDDEWNSMLEIATDEKN